MQTICESCCKGGPAAVITSILAEVMHYITKNSLVSVIKFSLELRFVRFSLEISSL